MLVSYTIQLSITCSACKQPVPVNGLVASLPCYHCGESQELSANFWKSALDHETMAAARAMKEGAAKSAMAITQGRMYELAYGHRSPRCHSCKGPSLELETVIGMTTNGHCFCPQCGHEIRIRAPDKLAHAVAGGAQALVGETSLDADAKAQNAKTTPILFPCMGCGGGLPVDGSHRQVSCPYCQAANYLPDGLWQQVNPVPKVQVFFLICETEAKGRGHENPLETEAHHKQTVPARLLELSREQDVDVRVAVAHNRHASAEALWGLAHDADIEVVRAVASNFSTPQPIQLELATNEDVGVLKALLHNATLPRAVVKIAATHADGTVRALATQHPNGFAISSEV